MLRVVYSMTGYAVQMRDIGRGILHLELRTVNSRYLDMNFRIAEEVRIVEPGLREMISGRLNRGKVDCRLNLLPSTTAPREASLNRALLQPLDGEIYAFRLTCSEAEMERRIRQRAGPENADSASVAWELQRFRELVTIQEEAALHGDLGRVVDTSTLSAVEVARQIKKLTAK